MTDTSKSARHHWRFFRAGGFDQVKLDRGADIAALDQLDQKLWVALACPTRGLEFDEKTLDLIDTDHDGRIRAPEIIAAAKWACAMLKNPDELTRPAPALPLASINDATPEGRQLLSSARQILLNLGQAEPTAITTADTADTVKIFAQTKFNGDGIIPADSTDDPALSAIITDIIKCLGGEADRSGKQGLNAAKLDLFFANAEAYAGWYAKTDADPALLPLGASTTAAAAAIKAVAAKIDDYFTRCRFASFDPRATAAVNRAEADYVAVAAQQLSPAGTELAAFPLARVEPGRPLPLTEGLNPGWHAAIDALNAQVIKPLLGGGGEKTSLTETEWSALVAQFAPFDAWLAAKAGGSVEQLGLARVREILAGPAKAALTELLAKDKALEPEATSIAAVDQLVRYYRDLYHLLNNFVSFHDFYGRRDKAIFQAGTLYLDQRSCELCVRVADSAKHGTMAHLAYTYLAYCDLERKATKEKMSIAAAFTGGDSDNLMVGRNGIFYDRKGQDWDATITKIVEHPISIRQAFWAPYKRVARFISDQLAKRAAAADAAAQTRLQTAATSSANVAVTGVAPPPPPPASRVDVGVVAALGVAVGGLTTAFAYFLGWLTAVPKVYLPLYVVLVILLISLPSMILAALKLRQRNLGPILDANGWAVNAKARLNIPFGGALTAIAKLPPGSHRDLHDPFAQSKAPQIRALIILILLLTAACMWYFGCLQRYLPDWLPKSSHVLHRQAAATQKAADDTAAKLKAQAEAPTTPTAPAK